jgi:hypothetical protein
VLAYSRQTPSLKDVITAPIGTVTEVTDVLASLIAY